MGPPQHRDGTRACRRQPRSPPKSVTWSLRTGLPGPRATRDWTPARTGLGLIRYLYLAPARGDVLAVLAAVHHAADAITRIADEDRLAVRQAAFEGGSTFPLCVLPARDQIPYQHAPIGWPRARRLLATYTAVIDEKQPRDQHSRQPRLHHEHPEPLPEPDPGLRCPAHPERSGNTSLVPSLEHDTHHSVQPERGALGQVIRDLSISEPATLLRAAALDQGVDALTADANAQSQRRAAALDIPSRLIKHLHSEATAAWNPQRSSAGPDQARALRPR